MHGVLRLSSFDLPMTDTMGLEPLIPACYRMRNVSTHSILDAHTRFGTSTTCYFPTWELGEVWVPAGRAPQIHPTSCTYSSAAVSSSANKTVFKRVTFVLSIRIGWWSSSPVVPLGPISLVSVSWSGPYCVVGSGCARCNHVCFLLCLAFLLPPFFQLARSILRFPEYHFGSLPCHVVDPSFETHVMSPKHNTQTPA